MARTWWAVACTLAACATSEPESTSAGLDAAIATLATDGPRWTYELRKAVLVRGTLQVPAPPLAPPALGAARDRVDMAGNRVWSSTCGLGDAERVRGDGAPASTIRFYIHERDREDSLQHLRQANGQSVWLLSDGPGFHAASDVHIAATTGPQLAAVCRLFDTPLADLVDGVARPDPRIDELFAELRARRLGAQQVLARLEPWDASLLPALLHVLATVAATPRAGDAFDREQRARMVGYITTVHTTFDVACLASQALRNFLAPGERDDAARRAEVRALAAWLRIARIAPMPATMYQRPPE
jgi:hypothetical protein